MVILVCIDTERHLTFCGGDLVYTSFFNQEIIVINSEKVARALLEQRSNIYSDRPEIATNAL